MSPAEDPQRLLAAQQRAAAFFHQRLLDLEDGRPLAYLRSRGIPPALARSAPWRLGYAPPSASGLAAHLRAHGFRDDELVAAGLAYRPRTGRWAGRTLDVFRNRVVFPVRDGDGLVRGFVGRDLSGNPRAPRYRNTRTTAVYAKSQYLFGLVEQSPRAVLLVEGPADAVALSRLGGVMAVSPCGTAVSAAQVALLARTVPVGAPLAVSFDPDDAGRRAARRVYDLLADWAGPVDAIRLPARTDPAALVAAHGPRWAAQLLAAHREPLLAALVADRVAGYRLDEIEGRVAALRSAGRLLRDVTDRVPRDRALLPLVGRELAVRLGFDGVTVFDALRR